MARSTKLSELFTLKPSYERSWGFFELSKRSHPYMFDMVGARYEGRRPIPFLLKGGKKLPGVIRSDTRMDILSGPLINLLRRVKATGLTTHPVIVYDRHDQKVVDRSCVWLKTQIGCGPVDLNSGVHLMRLGGESKNPDRLPIGLHFDPATWTGLDIFTPPNCGPIIITRRIADAIRSAEIVGIEVESVQDYGSAMRNDMITVWGEPGVD